MIDLDEALERVLALIDEPEVEHVAIENAVNRVLAARVVAHLSQPPFNASAMDGYAMRGADVVAGGTLQMVGESQAGAGYDAPVEQGQCIRIYTGAPLPSGADTVIMQEKTKAKGKTITFEDAPTPGQNVRALGQDFLEGSELLQPGAVMTSGMVALAATAGNDEVSVYQKPDIAILATGNELVPPGTPVAPGQIVASNTAALSALFTPFAGAIEDLGIAGDTKADLRDRLEPALNGSAKVVVTTGGASVGDHDLVQPVLKSLGVEIDFWKVAMRPGKPIMVGKKGDTLVFGLPGNPVSALVSATVLVLPALRALNGMADTKGKCMRLPLAAKLPPNGPRRHFIRATIEARDNGISAVYPIGQTDSAHLSSFAKADALIVHSENAEEQGVGEIVDVIQI